MKKLLFILSLVLLMASCSSKEGAGKYTLTSYDTGDTVQQAKIDQQKAIFEGEVEDSYYSRLVVDGKRLGFVVEAGEITIDWDKHEVKGGVLNERLNDQILIRANNWEHFGDILDERFLTLIKRRKILFIDGF